MRRVFHTVSSRSVFFFFLGKEPASCSPCAPATRFGSCKGLFKACEKTRKKNVARLTPAEVLSFAKENGFDNAKQVRQGRRRGLGGEEALQ